MNILGKSRPYRKISYGLISLLEKRGLVKSESSPTQQIIKNTNLGKLQEVLEGLAEFEMNRRTAPHKVGVMLETYLSTEDGLRRLGAAADSSIKKFPDSILLTYLRVVARGKTNRIEDAHDIIIASILESKKEDQLSKYGKSIAEKRTVALLKTWRVLDLIARENMCWLNEGKEYDSRYENLSFLSEEDVDNDDPTLSLFFAEPLLQGKHIEKYLRICKAAFEKADTLAEKLKIIFAMRREGIRRIKSYHEPYECAKDLFFSIKPVWVSTIRPLELATSKEPKNLGGLIAITRTLLNVSRALDLNDEAKRMESVLVKVANSTWSFKHRWLIAFALMEHDCDKHYGLTKQLTNFNKGLPQKPADIKNFLNWAILAQEYEVAYTFFSKQPGKIKLSPLGLLYAKILQRLGYFEEATNITQGVQAAMLVRPHTICPYISWNTVKRAGELAFLQKTKEFYSLVKQPSDPKGVIIVTSRTIEQLRKTPLVVLMELKRMGWAVIPLVEGLLPKEVTGIAGLDSFNGCISPDRKLTRQASMTFSGIENFEIDVENKILKWGEMDLSHGLWEEAAINRRSYNIDYTCPATKGYLNNVSKWSEVFSITVSNLHKEMNKLMLRTGLLIQFNSRLPDMVYRFYCEAHGDEKSFFCLHAANGYQNYFSNFSTNVSVKGIMRNMTRFPETRSASFPTPSEFEMFYRKHKKKSEFILDKVQSVTKVKRSTEGEKELAPDAAIALSQIKKWKENGGKVACAFGKVVFDSAVPKDGGPVHNNMKTWINDTIDCVRDSNTLLLIKPHPHELKEEIACFLNEVFFDLIEVELPDNVILVGHRWFDIHMLDGMVDLGLIYNGTTAVELGVLGIPSVLCSDFAPIDYPIGHETPIDADHYRGLVRFEEKAKTAEDLQLRAACWLHYMGSEEFTRDYRYHARPVTNKVLYPSWWYEEDMRAYLMRGDKNVSDLASRAID